MRGVAFWMWTPLSGATLHAIPPWMAWHGRLMVLGWSVLLPVGVLVARFFKVIRREAWPMVLDDKRWWRTHVGVQTTGIAVMTVGFLKVLGRAHGSSALAVLHHRIGYVVVALGWLQVLGGLLRGSKGGPTAPAIRGDHYDMTPRRIAFEIVHKTSGWLAMPLVMAGSAAGLVLADAPRWMAMALGLWWLLLAALFVGLQRSGRCIDTYHAIWGPGLEHPGNRRRPIGWGITRRTPAK